MNENNQQISKKGNHHGQIIKQEIEMSFSGPLPPPEILKKYDEVLPGSVERIIKMAEQQAEHRRSLEQQVIKSDIKNSKLGILCGFLIGMSGIVGGVVVATFGQQPLFGGILSFASLAVLAGVFVHGTESRRKERAQK
ncbi:MAG: DUF2335 domain-containing protein [Candidatus Gribaldobacteria bacterium]|nr:DUF2335 domain-containing protein [Candidatus Gribaldobacteria bacterium]